MESTISTTARAAVDRMLLGTLTLGDGQLRLKKIAVSGGSTTEVDSGWDLPSDAIVYDVLVNVTTAEVTGSTKTLDVGLLSSETGGDVDAFLDGVDLSATGVKRGLFVTTVGSNNSYLGAAATHTIGAKLTGVLIAGEDTTAGGDGFAMKAPHVASSLTAKSISYTRGSTLTEFVGEIWILYTQLSVAA